MQVPETTIITNIPAPRSDPIANLAVPIDEFDKFIINYYKKKRKVF